MVEERAGMSTWLNETSGAAAAVAAGPELE
jgi:hypothetical protein